MSARFERQKAYQQKQKRSETEDQKAERFSQNNITVRLLFNSMQIMYSAWSGSPLQYRKFI